MRSIVIYEFGPPENFAIEDQADPIPGPGEVRIVTAYAGISFVDVLIASGRYQVRPPVPFVPGNEIAGVIDAVGSAVSQNLLGQRVCALTTGAFSEKKVVPAAEIFSLPNSMDLDVGAIFLSNYITASFALVDKGQMQARETVVILGAGGAVGYAAVQIAKALGAFVIASASTEQKRVLAMRGGADAAVDTQAKDWREQVRAANGGKPVDIVLDPISGTATERAFRSLAWGGRHLIVGFASGSIARLPVNLPLLKGAALIGVDIRQATERDPSLQRRIAASLFAQHAEGLLSPPIAKVYPFEEVVSAAQAVAAGDLAGRVVLKIGQ